MRRLLGEVATRRLIGIVFLLCAVAPALRPATLTIAGGTTPENILFAVDGDLSTFSYYNVGFRIDPVLRNVFHGGATFNIWLFRFGIGAFFSALDEGGVKYAPGLFGSIGIEAPGAISLFVEYGLNPLADLSSDGDVYLNYGKLEAAIWLPHVLFRVIMQKKSLRVEPAGDRNLDNSLIRYQALLDIFSKNFPLLITLGGGYETMTAITTPLPNASVQYQEEEIASSFAFFEISWTITPEFTLFLNGEVPIPFQSGDVSFTGTIGLKIILSNFYR
jgi:hypothetical protein